MRYQRLAWVLSLLCALATLTGCGSRSTGFARATRDEPPPREAVPGETVPDEGTPGEPGPGEPERSRSAPEGAPEERHAGGRGAETTGAPATATEHRDTPPSKTAGDVHLIDWADGNETRGLFVETTPAPQPAGRSIGRITLHHAYHELRLVANEPAAGRRAVILDGTSVCSPRVTRVRRVHSLLVTDQEDATPTDPVTYVVLEFRGCSEGTAGVMDVAPSDVRVRSLRGDDLSERPTSELVESVRHVDDDVWGTGALPTAQFRMLEAAGVTFVVGNAGWVMRAGVVQRGPEPIALIEVGSLAYLEVQTPSETWLTSLSSFTPPYSPASCEVIDASGTALNVRAQPRGRARVVTTLERGARVEVNDTMGSWRHLATSPPGWAHESGVRCDELRPYRQAWTD